MNTETLVKVSDEDVGEAYEHFKEMFFPGTVANTSEFWAFIGCTYKSVADHTVRYWELPEKAAHYVNLLKGPHYKAIAKAMVINGHQYKEPLK